MAVVLLVLLVFLFASAQEPRSLTTIAGLSGPGGYNGDGIPATLATLFQPAGTFGASDGSLFIADRVNDRLRKVSPTGNISTIAGTGVAANTGDGGLAIAARIRQPTAVGMTSDGRV